MFEPGFIVEDRWEIVGPLDTGSMSLVYRGIDRTDGHPVAVKVMKPGHARDPVLVQRCVREARIVQALHHDAVVRVEGAGTSADGRPFIVMELLVGETLEVRIARGRLPTAVAVAVVAQVAGAVDAAHAAGIVHRDLKPDNVFILETPDQSLRVKILDFGFAKLADARNNPDGFRTESNALLGTPLYMAPEQIRASRDVDFRADLWSLGVMAYELLVGRPPFDAGPVPDLFVEILTGPIAPPTRRASGLPPSVDSWAVRALERDPGRRFQSGRELADALSAAMRGVMTLPPPPPASPGPRPPRSAPPPSEDARREPGPYPRFSVALALAVVTAAVLALLLYRGMAHGAPACPPRGTVVAPHGPCASSSLERGT